jgi:Domain of unknown function (DUF2024)
MECAVYDTYVTKKDGRIMHFDVVVDANTPHEKAIQYGKQYLFHSRRRRTKNDTRRMSVLSHTGSTTIRRKDDRTNGLLDSKDGGLRSLDLPSSSYVVII